MHSIFLEQAERLDGKFGGMSGDPTIHSDVMPELKSFLHLSSLAIAKKILKMVEGKIQKEITIQSQLAKEWTGIDIGTFHQHRINPHGEKVEALSDILTTLYSIKSEIEKR